MTNKEVKVKCGVQCNGRLCFRCTDVIFQYLEFSAIPLDNGYHIILFPQTYLYGYCLREQDCQDLGISSNYQGRWILLIASDFLLHPQTLCQNCRAHLVYTYHRHPPYTCWQCQLNLNYKAIIT